MWFGVDWVESFCVVLLSFGLELVCDKLFCELCDLEVCKEFWELNLFLLIGIDGIVNLCWEWFFVLK